MQQRCSRSIPLVALVVCSLLCNATDKIKDLRPTVLLISIDGFRPDYLGPNTPNLNTIAARGVRAKWLIPSFPTKTFPNHYTIVTGLYPAHTGIIANNMVDPTINGKFTPSDHRQMQNPAWWGGEPIWVTAEKQGLETAPLDWPGSEAAIEDTHPTYWREFEPKLSPSQRVEKLLPYFDKPSTERPRFLTLYMDEVDEAGHASGPGSRELKEAVTKVDEAIGGLMAGLRERGIEDQVNIIVVSDHGMAPTSRKRLVVLDDYIDLKTVSVADWGPPVALRALDRNNAALAEKLKRVPHAQVYLANDIPARYHYADSTRIMPVILLADDGWTIGTRGYVESHPRWTHGGQHGYDNDLKSMRATFIAAGPAFTQHAILQPFSNVHIYSLMAYLLNLRPAETDGSINLFKSVLVKRSEAPRHVERAPWRHQDELAVLR